MRPHPLLRTSLIAALLLVAAGTAAQTMPYPPAATARIASVEVSAAARSVQIHTEEAERIAGAYKMSNGWHLKVLTSDRHIDATIDKQRPIRLAAVGPYKFVSADGNVTMDFNQGRDGDDMRMSYVPDLRLGQRVVLESRLAQR